MKENEIPEGFKRFNEINDFGDVLQPLYVKYLDDKLIFGMQIEQSHINKLGICHGGVFMTFMDFALSAQTCFSMQKFLPTPTINLSVDFLASAKLGEFIWADVETLRLSRNIGFTRGMIRCGDRVLARANGNFKLPDEERAKHALSLEQFKEMYASL